MRATTQITAILILALLLTGCALPVQAAPATCAVEVGFSPEGSAQELVLRAVESANREIRLAGYSFTSPEVVRALVAAHRRGVDVRVVVDRRGNTGKANVAALNLLAGAGIPTRTISAYAIHHDKFIVADRKTVETGSFNYTRAAAQRNSENALLVSACPSLAKQYLEHWESRWGQGVDWKMTY